LKLPSKELAAEHYSELVNWNFGDLK
jgi:hypothetical protein